jgi:hypothetical protein
MSAFFLNEGNPNKLVMITDSLAATILPATESFTTIQTARLLEVPPWRFVHAGHRCVALSSGGTDPPGGR